MGFKSPLENWNVWQKKSRTAEESLILRDSRMSGCTSTCKHLDFRYSAKIWGGYTQNSQISTLFIHFSLENLVVILGDCLKLGTLKFLFIFSISVEVCREVE